VRDMVRIHIGRLAMALLLPLIPTRFGLG
jgi:hypothetical protein